MEGIVLFLLPVRKSSSGAQGFDKENTILIAPFSQGNEVRNAVNRLRNLRWQGTSIEEGICFSLALKWLQLHIKNPDTGRTGVPKAFERMAHLRRSIISFGATQIAFYPQPGVSCPDSMVIDSFGVNYDICRKGETESVETIADVAKHIWCNPGHYLVAFKLNAPTANDPTRSGGHATACYSNGQKLAFFDPNYGEFLVKRQADFERDLRTVGVSYNNMRNFKIYPIMSVIGTDDQEFLTVLNKALMDYGRSLQTPKPFRWPSKESLNANNCLKQAVANNDIPKLKSMLRYYLGLGDHRPVSAGQATAPPLRNEYGMPLKMGSTFHKILKEAFYPHRIFLNEIMNSPLF